MDGTAAEGQIKQPNNRFLHHQADFSTITYSSSSSSGGGGGGSSNSGRRSSACIIMAKVVETVMEVFKLLCGVVYYWVEALVLAFVPTPLVAKDISGQTVLITGAGSGIGRLLALEFAALNCRLALWDISDEGNYQTARMVAETGTFVKTYTVDVSDRDQVYKAAAKVTSEMGAVDILVNNAGIVSGRKILDVPDSMIEKTIGVNTMSHFWTVKAFLPAMLTRDHGHVVSIASSAGLVGAAGLVDYCSSKFGAVGFDESLRFELRGLGKRQVHTTVVCPFLIATGMFDGCTVRFPWLLNALDPEEVAKKIVDAVLRNQQFLVIPRPLYALMALKGILPAKCLVAMADYLGGNRLMDTFKGRAERPN